MTLATYAGRAFFGAALLVSTQSADAASSLKLVYAGSGVVKTYSSPTATFQGYGDGENATIYVSTATEWYYIDLAAPRGRNLVRGSYTKAERAPFRTGRAPGVSISGNGSGCNEVWGSFTIRQIGFAPSGAVNKLDATVINQCESAAAPKLTATVLFNADPWTFSYASTAGDPVGGGRKDSYLGHTADFALEGTRETLTYAVSGDRDEWIVALNAPDGQQLSVGTYPTARFAGPGVAGLHAQARIDALVTSSHECEASTGSLTIKDIATDELDQVVGLHATFIQYCDGASAPLKGTIRYYR